MSEEIQTKPEYLNKAVDIGKELTHAKNFFLQNLGVPGIAATALGFGSEYGKSSSLPRAALTAAGTGAGYYLGGDLYNHLSNNHNTKHHIDNLKEKVDNIFGQNVSRYFPTAAKLLGGTAGYLLTKSSSEDMNKTASVGSVIKTVVPMAAGTAAAEYLFNNDNLDTKTKWLNRALGAISGGTMLKNPMLGLSTLTFIPGKDIINQVNNSGVVGSLNKALDTYNKQPDALNEVLQTVQQAQSNSPGILNKGVSINSQSQPLSDKLLDYGILGLGVAGLTLGGYALYDYLQRKRSSRPVVRVNLEGDKDDPYDNAVVELPLNDVSVSQKLTKGVNRSLKQIIRENSKYSSRKKDPYTGKLISYEEYVAKYGEPSN